MSENNKNKYSVALYQHGEVHYAIHNFIANSEDTICHSNGRLVLNFYNGDEIVRQLMVAPGDTVDITVTPCEQPAECTGDCVGCAGSDRP